MKIGLISKLWEETSSASVGGTGAVVGYLADELVDMGHDVTVFATGNSATKAKVVSVKETPWDQDYSSDLQKQHVEQAFSDEFSFDVIDSYCEDETCEPASLSKTPTIINITYGALFDDHKENLKKYRDLNYVSPSLAMRNSLPAINWKAMIPHGIRLDRFDFSETHDNYLLFLGRVSPQKGPGTAIRVALKTGLKLIIAGKMSKEDQTYLDKEVLPFIDGTQIVYVGVADFKTKINLLRNALALIHPIEFIEAFGMTIIESMACGTPVISFDKGAPKEIIIEDVTGFVVTTEDEMCTAVEKTRKISRKDCRTHVEKNYTAKLMAQRYEALYKKIIGS